MASGTERILEGVPPHDEEAEVGVLGAMLCEERAAGIAIEMLIPEDFYIPRHKTLFQFFSELFQTHPNLDLLYVRSELDRRGLSERVGGREILGQLIEQTPTAANIEVYANLVRERAIERNLIEGAGKIIQLCREPQEGGAEAPLLDRAEEVIFRICDQRSSQEPLSMQAILSGVLLDAERHFHARREGREIPCPALSTGFHDLDKRFAGGLWPGEVVVVAARPSVGKTTLVLNIARKIACQPPEKQPVPVALFSLEMPREQVSKNILCAEGHILSQRMRNYAFDEEEFESVQLAAGNLKKAPLFIDDTPGLSPAELRARARRLRHREKVGLIAIDYLQLMQPAKKADSREQAVSDMSRQVKHLARELNIPILLISQLRRPIQGQENHKPHLSDLRESGAIEQDADVVIMLHRDMDELGVMGKDVTAIVQKNRNGETGEVRLSFFPEQFRFESYSPAFDEGVAKEA